MTDYAVLAHGSGSDDDFVRRACADALAAAGYELVPCADRSGDVTRVAARLADLVRRTGARLVGGVSLGAHAAAAVAAGRTAAAAALDGVLLLLPAWTGPPDDVARTSAVAADRVARDGLAAALADLPDGWVADELRRAWPRYGTDALVRSLHATARAPAPTPRDLAAVTVPTGLVAVRDDGLHPEAVARRWAAALPRACLSVLDADAPAADRGVLGRAAVQAWLAAGGRPAVSGSR